MRLPAAPSVPLRRGLQQVIDRAYSVTESARIGVYEGPAIHTSPGVATVTEVESVQTGEVTCTCAKPIGDNFALLEVPPASLTRVTKLVAGRLPRQWASDEVLASFTLSQDKGIRVGSVLHVPLYGRQQAAAVAGGTSPLPREPQVTMRVVGIEAAENEFPVRAVAAL